MIPNFDISFEVWDNDTMSADDKLAVGRAWLPEESGTFEVMLLGHLVSKQFDPEKPPRLIIHIRMPETQAVVSKEDRMPTMPGSDCVGQPFAGLLPPSQLWPGQGRCRILPHDDEVSRWLS